MQNIDKVLERAAKLLAMQEHRGASEAEASAAAEHLQRLLQEHNLTLSQVEQRAGDGAAPVAKRIKESVQMPSETVKSESWRVALLKGIAANNFCLGHLSRPAYTLTKRMMLIIGREVNVNVTQMTYDYLKQAFVRAAKEHGYSQHHATRRDYVYFMDGAVSRVIERLNQRRAEREAEDAAKVKSTSSNGTHKEIVLSDVYGSESDLNNDLLNGYPPGTTATKQQEHQTKMAEQQTTRDRLVAEGVDSTVAWYRAYGYSEERALKLAKDYSRRSRRRGGRGGRSGNFSRRDEAEYRKVNSSAYKSGRRTGAEVGLDTQVGGGNPRRLG